MDLTFVFDVIEELVLGKHRKWPGQGRCYRYFIPLNSKIHCKNTYVRVPAFPFMVNYLWNLLFSVFETILKAVEETILKRLEAMNTILFFYSRRLTLYIRYSQGSIFRVEILGVINLYNFFEIYSEWKWKITLSKVLPFLLTTFELSNTLQKISSSFGQSMNRSNFGNPYQMYIFPFTKHQPLIEKGGNPKAISKEYFGWVKTRPSKSPGRAPQAATPQNVMLGRYTQSINWI